MPASARETEFEVPRMDCPSEERLIRLALQPEPGVHELRFDLEARRVVVRHEGESAPLLARLDPLGLGARIVGTREAAGGDSEAPAADAPAEGRVLRQLLAINAAMFGIELTLGLVAQSTGLSPTPWTCSRTPRSTGSRSTGSAAPSSGNSARPERAVSSSSFSLWVCSSRSPDGPFRGASPSVP